MHPTVLSLRAEHHFDNGVPFELLDYFSKSEFGDRLSARFLPKYACQALELSEHDLGTDLLWAKNVMWL